MGVESTHPDYDLALPKWELMRDATDGAETIKEAEEDYLPRPSGFDRGTTNGNAMWAAYLERADFPEITAPTVRGASGVIHSRNSQYELPKALEPLLEKATKDGLPLDALHRRITDEVLTTGRYGLLTDMAGDAKPGDPPFLAGYRAEAIINWDKTGEFFVLNETADERDPEGDDRFIWEEVQRFRELTIDAAGNYTQIIHEASDGGEITEQEAIEITATGGRAIEEIPFFVIGSTDVSPEIDEIPLIGVARAAVAEYRLDADYKYQLHMSGQDTFVVCGIASADKPEVVGAGIVLSFADKDTKAAYVGPAGKGIDAHRVAIQDERAKAVNAGARMFEDAKRTAESGEAMKTRLVSQTASLQSVASAVAQGLERALKAAAIFVGANPDEVVVKPNKTFIDTRMSPSDAKALVEVWMGGGVSYTTLYENLQRGEIASPERTADEERILINEEMPEPTNTSVTDDETGESVSTSQRPGPTLPGGGDTAPNGGGGGGARLSGATGNTRRFIETGEGLVFE